MVLRPTPKFPEDFPFEQPKHPGFFPSPPFKAEQVAWLEKNFLKRKLGSRFFDKPDPDQAIFDEINPLGEGVVVNPQSVDLELNDVDYLSITDATQTGLALSEDFTLEAWINAESVGEPMVIVAKTNATTNWSWALRVASDGKLLITVSSDGEIVNDGGWLQYTTDDAQIFTGTWTHIAVSFDISTETFLVYVNGASVNITRNSASTSLGATLFDNAAPFAIGVMFFNGNANSPFDGKITDVRVWSDIRTSTEILNNYTSRLIGSEANLVGYWKLNGNALDSTANDNDLTEGNTPTYSDDSPF